MPDNPPPKKKRRGLWWKIPLSGLIVLLLAFAVFRFVVHQRVQTRLAAIRDAGYPVTLEELDAWYPYPDGPNAADVYQRAFDAYVKDEAIEQTLPIFNSDIELPPPGEPLAKEMAQRIEAYLAKNAEAISLLEEAVKMGDCRFPINLTNGYDTLLPHLRELRHGARMLKLQSILDADRGDYDLAVDRCITMISLARALENEPIIIPQLVSTAHQRIAYEQIERLIATGNVSDNRLQALTQAIEPISLDHMVLCGMTGERNMGHALFNDTDELAEMLFLRGTLDRLVLEIRRTIGLLDIDHSCYLDIMQAHIDYAENPAWPVPAALIDDNLVLDQIPRLCTATRILAPALSSVYTSFRQCEAKRRVVLAGIAAERYRQEHGELPDQLDDLIPTYLDAVPEDPFDGQPPRYRLEDSGAIIYSIDADGQDNGGREVNDTCCDSDDIVDITFTFGGLQEKLWPQDVNGEP